MVNRANSAIQEYHQRCLQRSIRAKELHRLGTNELLQFIMDATPFTSRAIDPVDRSSLVRIILDHELPVHELKERVDQEMARVQEERDARKR